MRVWRLAKDAFAPLDGEGGRLYGGRWNSPGLAMVYTAAHLSLAVVELLVHMDPDLVPSDLRAFEIDIPDDLIVEPLDPLPRRWHNTPAPAACQRFGDEWLLSRRSVVLAVPSVVIRSERNYLLNPNHPDMNKIRVVDSFRFTFDSRLL
jgi:RES domain-containing protein